MFGQTEGVKPFLLPSTRFLMPAAHSVFWHGLFLVAYFLRLKAWTDLQFTLFIITIITNVKEKNLQATDKMVNCKICGFKQSIRASNAQFPLHFTWRHLETGKGIFSLITPKLKTYLYFCVDCEEHCTICINAGMHVSNCSRCPVDSLTVEF